MSMLSMLYFVSNYYNFLLVTATVTLATFNTITKLLSNCS